MRLLLPLSAALLFLAISHAEAGDVKPSRIDLSKQVDQVTTLEGKVSQEPWQHLVGSYPNLEAHYFDLQDGSQIVIYAPKGFDCLERCKVTGKVVAITGGGKGHKSEEVFTEHHLVVDSFQCLGNPEVETRLDRLADPALSREAKDKIEHELRQLGKGAIPTLIQHLKDGRLCWKERVLVNAGELTNRPVSPPPPKEEWAEEAVTLGMRADRLLHRIITPKYESPHAKNFKPFSGGSYLFKVPDWRAWWDRERFRSLDAIHQDMQKVVDAYWQSHGTQQVVK